MTGRIWRRGALTGFVDRHALVWELTMAALTVAYVVLAFAQDQQASVAPSAAVFGLAAFFAAEFFARLYDSPSRLHYLKSHWLDILTCVPVVGSFRAFRLVRLVAFIRIGAAARAFGTGMAASNRIRGGSGIWVLAPLLLIVWVAASYGYYEIEGGINPRIQSFNDALYFSFVTATTVGYGDVTPVTQAGKVLTGILIFVGIGLVGFASSQLTAALLPQRNEIAELKSIVERQNRLLQQLLKQADPNRDQDDAMAIGANR